MSVSVIEVGFVEVEYVLLEEVESSGAYGGMLLWPDDVGEVGGRTLSWERR